MAQNTTFCNNWLGASIKNPTNICRWDFFIDNAEPKLMGMTSSTYFKRMSRIEYYIAGCAYCQD